MRPIVIIFTSLLGASISTNGVSQDRDVFDLECLSSAQQSEIIALSKKLIADLRLYEDIERLRKLSADELSSRDQAIECRRRLENLGEVLKATVDGCPQKIDRYKFLSSARSDAERTLTEKQNIVRSQIRLERGKWPACR